MVFQRRTGLVKNRDTKTRHKNRNGLHEKERQVTRSWLSKSLRGDFVVKRHYGKNWSPLIEGIITSKGCGTDGEDNVVGSMTFHEETNVKVERVI